MWRNCEMNIHMMLLADFFTVISAWCNLCVKFHLINYLLSKSDVPMEPVLSSLAALWTVITTTSGAPNGCWDGIVTTSGFQCSWIYANANYVSTEVVCKYPLVILWYISIIYAFIHIHLLIKAIYLLLKYAYLISCTMLYITCVFHWI